MVSPSRDMEQINEEEVKHVALKCEDVDMYCAEEDVGTNVTICHEQESSLEENALRFEDSDGGEG